MAKMGKDTVKGKRKYNSTDEAVMQEAVTEVIQDKLSLNKAAKVFGIPKSTLDARLRNVRTELPDSQEEPSIMGLRGLKNKKKVNKFASGQTFTMLQEENLVDYLLDASKLNYGITLMEARELAYNWAISIGHKVPESWKPFLPLNIQQTSAQEINLREATFHENVSHEIVPQDPSSLEIIAHEATFLGNVSQKSQIEEIRLQDIVEESTIHDNFFTKQSLISSDDQALDLTVSTRELQDDNRGMMVQKTCPIPNIPLDLSVNSNTHSKPHAFQLRYGGLEIIRPLPSPPKTKKKKQGMVSTIATSSPELKKKEDMQMKKRVKDKVKEENKRMKEEKKNQGKSTPKTAQRKILPDTEVPIPQKKKRGRPPKVPSLSEV